MTRTSKATWQAFYSMNGPFAVAQGFMFVTLIVFAVFQPAVDRPDTYPALAVVILLFLVAGGFMVAGTFRFLRLRKSAKEDRRRIAAGPPWTQRTKDDGCSLSTSKKPRLTRRLFTMGLRPAANGRF